MRLSREMKLNEKQSIGLTNTYEVNICALKKEKKLEPD